MAFIKGHEFILENKFGMIFNFYLNEQRHIEYIISDKKRKWKEKNVVFSERIESLHIEIDNKDNIHIISYSENGNLYYHQYNNKKWINHLIVQYPVAEQKIIYPTIKYVNNQIHIFYYLLNNKQKNKAYLLHLKSNNKQHNANHIANIYSHAYINPFKIFVKDDEILLVYGSVVKEYDQLFISKFNMVDGKWHSPICLTSSKDKKIYIDGLLDNMDTLHLIWSGYDEEHLVVQYLKLDSNKISKTTGGLEPISLSLKSSCSFPVLVYYEKILWAIWTEMGKVISCYSVDVGKSWSKPYIHENTKNLNFKRYRYITNSVDNNNNILCDFVFGTLYPDIQFLGFGGEIDDEISADQ